MEQRRIGSLEVPLAGIGCNNFGGRIDESRAAEVVDAAFDVGATHFDTAETYANGASEAILGRALKGRRDRAVVTSKFGSPRPGLEHPGGAANVRRAIEGSLERLDTDHIDLYLIHRPDPTTPIAETLTALDALVAEGKVREIGCSVFSVAELQEAADVARELGTRSFVNLQSDYSLLERDVEQEVLPTVARLGMSFVPYFPLAMGLLTGKYRRDVAPPSGTRLAGDGRFESVLAEAPYERIDRLEQFASDRGHTLPELALSWLAGDPLVASVIAGATSPEQVRQNAAATTAWALDDDERTAVASIV